MKLGKKPARPDAVAFKFGAYFDKTALPKPPPVFGHEAIKVPWGVLGNDQWSDCVWAGAAHETMLWTRVGSGSPVEFTTNNVLADYAAATGFDPTDPNSDQGSDMEQAASYRRTVGIADERGQRHKIDAYVALKAGDTNDLATAAYLFGAVGVGLEFPDSAMDQFDHQQRWDVVPGDAAGGHYVPCVGRNSNGDFLVVTWGRLQAMSPAFYRKWCDEAVAYVSLEALKGNVSAEGFDVEALRGDLKQLRK